MVAENVINDSLAASWETVLKNGYSFDDLLLHKRALNYYTG